MAARIEQLQQRLAAMTTYGVGASCYHEGENFFNLASAAHVQASVAMTIGVVRASKLHSATVKLDLLER